jgi:hypothetical protein
MIEELMREFVDVACECEVRDYLISEYAERIKQAIAAMLGSEHHAYEQRITGDGSDWGEIMRNAYDDLMATACESCTPEQMEQLSDYIRAELRSDASAVVRLAERLRSIADEMRNVGASTMTPHELLACYASDVDKVADSLMFAAKLGSGACEWATDCEGVRIDVADTVHMLRSEYDGDHEWDDVVIELAYCKHGGDRWIVRGVRGEAWACDCTVTGHDEELYDKSDDWENLPTPWDAPEPDGWHKCPECGCTVGYTELYGGGWSIMMDDYQIPYNNCPKCGRPILMCDVEVER